MDMKEIDGNLKTFWFLSLGPVEMNIKTSWNTKLKIMRVCALLSAGGVFYRLIQKAFGRLRANHIARIPVQIEMARWILDMSVKVEGKPFHKVDTGHCPIVPIGFFLCGAEKFVTVDFHRRLDLGILKKSLEWIV